MTISAEAIEHARDRDIVDALDVARLDELARLAELAASYWHSVALAADRGDALTVAVHCKQIAAVTREAFAIARALGSAEPET